MVWDRTLDMVPYTGADRLDRNNDTVPSVPAIASQFCFIAKGRYLARGIVAALAVNTL